MIVEVPVSVDEKGRGRKGADERGKADIAPSRRDSRRLGNVVGISLTYFCGITALLWTGCSPEAVVLKVPIPPTG